MTTENNTFQPTLIKGDDLQRHLDLEDALLEFARLFRNETNDRAMVIVGASFLDIQLEHIIANFFVDDRKEVESMMRPDQTTGTYGGKIRLAYLLGLIGPNIRDDLKLIGKIRNKFAHNLYASFEQAQIRSWAIALSYHRIALMTPPEGVTPRDLFNVGLNQVASYLSGIASIARSERRTIRYDGER